MNKRIEKLVKEATINIGDEFHPIDFFDKEKFAELIVRECAHITWLNSTEDNVAHIKIKEHFGIEE